VRIIRNYGTIKKNRNNTADKFSTIIVSFSVVIRNSYREQIVLHVNSKHYLINVVKMPNLSPGIRQIIIEYQIDPIQKTRIVVLKTP